MPATASLPIPAALDQLTGQQPPDPVALARRLHDVLEEVVDPRKRRGVRHRLVVVITVAVCAVAAGARSFVAISEWVTDLPAEVAAALGITGRCPCESTIRRIVQRLDGDRFDALISGFVQRLCAARRPGGRRRVLAVDGKTLRGARDTGEGGGDHEPARHLLAVIDHDVRGVLGQIAVNGKSNELIGRCAAPGRAENLPRPVGSTPCDLGAGESVNELGAGASGRRPGVLPVST